jgi:PIF1-like helicase
MAPFICDVTREQFDRWRVTLLSNRSHLVGVQVSARWEAKGGVTIDCAGRSYYTRAAQLLHKEPDYSRIVVRMTDCQILLYISNGPVDQVEALASLIEQGGGGQRATPALGTLTPQKTSTKQQLQHQPQNPTRIQSHGRILVRSPNSIRTLASARSPSLRHSPSTGTPKSKRVDGRPSPKTLYASKQSPSNKLSHKSTSISSESMRSSLSKVPGQAAAGTVEKETSSTKVDLAVEQLEVVEACRNGKNVFFTGGAGTGKSALLVHIISELTTRHGRESVFVTATTGLSAFAIAGLTIHQFAGIGAVDKEDDDCIDTVVQAVRSYSCP